MSTTPPRPWTLWAIALVLGSGVLMTSLVLAPRARPLRRPLQTVVPASFGQLVGSDVAVSAEEQDVSGVTDYVMRVYREGEASDAALLSIYVGFYPSQTGGKTIHSPKNCMPGSGWDALESRTEPIGVGNGPPVLVNRYLLVNEGQRILVLYWYQGRGRVVSSEYQAKWDLLRDASLKRRSDEALVRIVSPIIGEGPDAEAKALALAKEAAQRLLPDLDQALPAA